MSTSRRGRSAVARTAAEVEPTAERPRKRARKSAEQEDGDNAGPARVRRSPRDRNAEDGSHWWQSGGGRGEGGSPSAVVAATASQKTGKAAKKTKKQKNAPQPEAAAEEDAPPTKKRGRPSLDHSGGSAKRKRPSGPWKLTAKDVAPAAAEEAAAVPASSSRKGNARKRRRRGEDGEQEAEQEAAEEGQESGEEEEEEEEAEEDEEDEDEPAQNTETPFQQLVPRTRLIPMSTMTAKWAPLEREAITAAHALLTECARPVLARLNWGGGAGAERRHEQARQAMAGVTRRLRSKLVKGIPFPPPTTAPAKRGGRRVGQAGQAGDKSQKGGNGTTAGHESDFDLDRTLDAVRTLERQLDPLRHSVALLERERTREERGLEADYAALRQLEKNAQAEMRSWRERERKAHALVPPLDAPKEPVAFALPPTVELVKREAGDEGGVFQNLQDKDLLALATQLGSHMESLRSNLQQIDGVVPAIARSKAALQQVLYHRLDERIYEQIVLGDERSS